MDNDLILKAIKIAKENRNCFSFTLLKRELRIGTIKCSKLIDVLENKKIIAPYNPNKQGRKVLI